MQEIETSNWLIWRWQAQCNQIPCSKCALKYNDSQQNPCQHINQKLPAVRLPFYSNEEVNIEATMEDTTWRNNKTEAKESLKTIRKLK